ncbi:oligosaccharide flippase family protein [Proteus mirabilis]|uniref:lipopolysaccharide biosynthesis protein n=1 Tax=Proteus mirabilis TaxID=584 RepID=UPI0018C49DC9|nr:oligosaccharide flippase family protein [Proteus mirabilis]MBG2713497.1 oligosaccharide flippase family protein [Proteus mirabilis]HEK0395660.1 oligosaccharide flippase family protein [Proteus mirabilis]HEK0597857.1 oligosaccharide flippase family protein [Proteus mirabilis]HEK1931399.1 oligosaccharide flippase family protein [Proteus mirabilis]HEK2974768.1 oligosaccharide flippase family protein [Proteus mirabilis]
MKKNNLLKQSVIYLSSNVLNASIPFILLPVFSYYLSTEEYGKIAIFQIILSGLNAIIGLNTTGAASRKYFDTKNKKILVQYNNSSFIILFLSSIIMFILFYSFSGSFISFFNIPKEWLLFAIFSSTLDYILRFKLTQLQVRNKAFQYGVIQVSNSFLSFTISIFLIVFLNFGAEGRIYGILITSLITAILCFISLCKNNLLSIKENPFFHIKDNLYFGVPLVPHILGVFLLSSIDRFIINKEYGLSEAGIYMMAVQVSLAIILVFDALNKTLMPYLFHQLTTINTNIEIKNKIILYSYIFFIFCILSGLLAAIISPYIINFIAGPKYLKAQEIVFWLCIGQSFQGLYLVVTNYITYVKKTYLLSLITIISGIINIILIFILIKKYGLVGVSYAFCISMFIRFILTWATSNWVYPMPWNIFKSTYFINKYKKRI